MELSGKMGLFLSDHSLGPHQAGDLCFQMREHEEQDAVLLEGKFRAVLQVVADLLDQGDLGIEGAEVLQVAALCRRHWDGAM